MALLTGAGVRGRPVLPLLVVVALVSLPTVGAHAQPPAGEYQVKAAFLYNFARFVEWPASAFADSAAAIRFAVLGSNPFGGALQSSLEDKKIADRRLNFVHFRRLADLGDCHVLFIGSSEAEYVEDVFETLADSPVLTVGESRNFAAQGGIIQFVLQDRKMRFEINKGAAEKAGLKISAKLMQLAIEVHDRKP